MACAIVTRDVEAAAPYAATLAPLGLDVIAMPVTRSEPIGGDALSRALVRRSYWAIACASPRAAAALIEAWNQPTSSDDATAPEVDVRGRPVLAPVWAVGVATARVLRDAGIEPIVVEGVRDGASLATAMIAKGVDGRRVVVPRAVDGRRELVDALAGAGAFVDAIDVYRTVPNTDATELAAGRAALPTAAVVIVFAPSQVAALDIRAIRCPFVAIGDTTAEALRAAGATAVAVAASPTPEGLAKAIATVYPVER